MLKVEGVSKIPVNVRQAYLDRFFDICILIYPEDSDARQRVSITYTASQKTIVCNLFVIALAYLKIEFNYPVFVVNVDKAGPQKFF